MLCALDFKLKCDTKNTKNTISIFCIFVIYPESPLSVFGCRSDGLFAQHPPSAVRLSLTTIITPKTLTTKTIEKCVFPNKRKHRAGGLAGGLAADHFCSAHL